MQGNGGWSEEGVGGSHRPQIARRDPSARLPLRHGQCLALRRDLLRPCFLGAAYIRRCRCCHRGGPRSLPIPTHCLSESIDLRAELLAGSPQCISLSHQRFILQLLMRKLRFLHGPLLAQNCQLLPQCRKFRLMFCYSNLLSLHTQTRCFTFPIRARPTAHSAEPTAQWRPNFQRSTTYLTLRDPHPLSPK